MESGIKIQQQEEQINKIVKKKEESEIGSDDSDVILFKQTDDFVMNEVKDPMNRN